jgi:ribosomal protein S18 acetylase RimI-like enzyme
LKIDKEMSTIKINEPIRLLAAQKDQASEVLTKAFQNDIMYTYIFPDPNERVHSLRIIWDLIVSYSLVYGEVYTTSMVNGVACWLSPVNPDIRLQRMLHTGMGINRVAMQFEKESRVRFLDMISYVNELHKRLIREPHWYLWALGVEPASQGQGTGGKLLKPVLTRADEERIPCYLETQKESNVAFYKKRGFEVLSEGEVPRHKIKAWAMLRTL